jgi:hypothetical protein
MLDTVCVHVVFDGHEQYEAPSFVAPCSLAQRQDQNTVLAAGRSAHCAWTWPTTDLPVVVAQSHAALPASALCPYGHTAQPDAIVRGW